jgi:hypothetical protein
MKKIVLGLSVFISSFAFAQEQGLEKIIVEKYYVSNTADSIASDLESADASYAMGALPVGSVTYRIYADLLPGYKIVQLFGDAKRGDPQAPGQPLIFTTSTSFYNNPAGGTTPLPTIKKNLIVGAPLLALDSYITLGAAAATFYGIHKDEDDAVASWFTASTPNGVLQNSAPVMGKPLTQKDGFITGTGIATPSFIGFEQAIMDVISDGSVIGDSVGLADGSMYATTSAMGPDPVTNKILIAQLTTNGKFTFKLNVLITKGGPDDKGQYYVATNPGAFDPIGDHAADIVLPSLTYPDVITDINTPSLKEYNEVAFSVYPNPANDHITLEIAPTQVNSKGSYTIYGIIGNVIAHKDLNGITGSYKETVDLSSYAKGLYTIQMNMNGKVSAKKIIKN